MRSKRPTFITAAIFVGAWMSAYPRAGAQQVTGRMSLPVPTGTYGVGRVSYALTDESRTETLSITPGARRKIMVFVWYPTDRKTTEGMKAVPYLPDFDKVLPKLSLD